MPNPNAEPVFDLTCKKCGSKKCVIEPMLLSCDTPVGPVYAKGSRAVCTDCEARFKNKDINEYNSMVMAVTTLGQFRRLNPDRTKKGAHRSLGLQKAFVDKFWDISLSDRFLPLKEDDPFVVAEIGKDK